MRDQVHNHAGSKTSDFPSRNCIPLDASTAFLTIINVIRDPEYLLRECIRIMLSH